MKHADKIGKTALVAVVLVMVFGLLPGCNNTVSEYVKPYRYEIEITLNNSPSDGKFPIYTFSRPVFEETSELAKLINQIFIQKQNALYDEMKKEEKAYESFPDDIGWDINNPWTHTELSECSFERLGIISFTLNGEWYMGGVRNGWKVGYTFDFNLGRELKIADVLFGSETQITATLEKEFNAWYERSYGFKLEDEYSKNRIKEQSGSDANFYLSKDGVHIFYEPYTVSGTQNGIDILIPWTRTELVQQLVN